MSKRSSPQQVDLLETIQVLHEHVTEALCEQVFEERRTTERRRQWSLHRLAEFWVEVTLQAPPSLRHALVQAQGGASGYPDVPASPQAFYSRAQNLPWTFFEGLFDAFRSRAAQADPPRFLPEMAEILDRFGVAVAIDGSKLDAVARRLKALWDDRRVPLPGALVALYDLRRGVLHRLAFNPKATPSEFHDAIAALDALPPGSLTLVDRLYGVPAWFAALKARGLYGVARRRGGVKLTRIRRLSHRRRAGGWLEDWEVDAGKGPQTPTQRLRLVRWQKGKTVHELFSNVLDPERLSAAEAMDLYPHRWKVERLFFDLKEVLNLNRFYAANVNAIAMQVFTAAIVHTALRIAQARLAARVHMSPERLSVPKLFPKVAAAATCLAAAELAFSATQDANPHVRLSKPDWTKLRFSSVSLDAILVQHRSPKRRKRRYCAARRVVRSLPDPRRSG